MMTTRRQLLQTGFSAGLLTLAPPALAGGQAPVVVHDEGVIGEFHSGTSRHRSTGVIMLNGSDGGVPSAAFAGDLASSGFSTLAVAYMKDAQGRPSGVPNAAPIPLESIYRAIEWMKRRPEVDPRKIVLMGVSRGAELALLVASLRRDVAGVIAFSPGSHVWGAPADLYRGVTFDRAMWSLGGNPVPFQVNKPDFRAPIRQWFARATVVDAAAIKVEDIAGPVMLVSSRADGEWPASEYANEITARLSAHAFRHKVFNLQYDDASHLLMGYGPAMTKLPIPGTDFVIDFGGSPAGTLRARDAAWKASKSFLRALRPSNEAHFAD